MSIIYRSERIGQNGRVFYLLKFRTFREGSDGGSPTASSDDPRLTWWGSILRRTKLDELPTVVNLIRGDIGIFGYRPEVVSEFATLGVATMIELSCSLPGLISPATVWNHNEDELLKGKEDPHAYYLKHIKPKKYRLAIWYQRNRTPWLDFKVLLATVLRVLRIPININCFPDEDTDTIQ